MFGIKEQTKKRTHTGEVIQESEKKGIEHKRKCNSAKRDNIKNKPIENINFHRSKSLNKDKIGKEPEKKGEPGVKVKKEKEKEPEIQKETPKKTNQ